MGFGKLLTRSTRYTVTDTVSGVSATYFVQDNLAPDWPSFDAYRGAMSIPGAWRAALSVSGLLGRLPWDAYRNLAGRPEEKLEPTPPLLYQPNPPETRMSSFRSWGLDYLWHGNAIGVIAARSPLNWPTAAIPVSASSVGVRRITKWDTDARPDLPVGALEYSIGELRFSAAEVIHFKGPCQPGAVRGMGVLENHLNTLSLAQDQNKQARAITNHGVPTGVLETEDPDVDDTQAEDMKKKWLASQATRSIAVLSPGTKFKPLSWNPEQLQLLEARKFTLNELELLFGLPVGWLGGTDSSRKYANVSQDDVSFMKWSMGDHIEQFEQTLTLVHPRGTSVRANQDAVLQADTLTRYQAHTIATAGQAWLLPDEVRKIEKYPPLPEKEVQPDAMTQGPPQESPGAGQAAA